MVALTAVFFKSDTSYEAPSFLSIPQSGPLTNDPDGLLHDRTVAVLDVLAYVSMDSSSSVIAVGLILNPIQLVIATNEDNPTKTMLKHLKAICFTLKKISDNKVFSQALKCRLTRVVNGCEAWSSLQRFVFDVIQVQLWQMEGEDLKRWKVVAAFRDQFRLWNNADQETERNKIEQKQIFLSHVQDFWGNALRLQDCLYKTCRPGCQTDSNEMGTLKRKLRTLIAVSAKILDLSAEGGTKACDYWAKKVAPNGKPQSSAYEIHSVIIKGQLHFKFIARLRNWFPFTIIC